MEELNQQWSAPPYVTLSDLKPSIRGPPRRASGLERDNTQPGMVRPPSSEGLRRFWEFPRMPTRTPSCRSVTRATMPHPVSHSRRGSGSDGAASVMPLSSCCQAAPLNCENQLMPAVAG